VFIVKARTIDGWQDICRTTIYYAAFTIAVRIERDYADVIITREV
jgi:hypothetical protein